MSLWLFCEFRQNGHTTQAIADGSQALAAAKSRVIAGMQSRFLLVKLGTQLARFHRASRRERVIVRSCDLIRSVPGGFNPIKRCSIKI